MVNIALGALALAAAASAVQVGVEPVATGYIYRSDNNGPASLIQLGSHAYAQALPAPLPIAQPLKAIDAYAIGPVPLPYVAAKPIVVLDEEDDEDEEEYEEEGPVGLKHGHAYEKGAGSDYGEDYHKAHGEKGSKGYKSNGHHAKGASGHYAKEHNEAFYNKGEGEKGGHHEEASAHGKHQASGGGYKGGDHGHKKHFSKGEDITGYHKVFHKDEFKKDHDFYDVADNSGHFKKHGYEKEQHGSAKGGHKEAGHHDSAVDKGEFGKAGSYAEGHIDDADNDHSAEEGHESHYENEANYGKKGGSGHEKEYAYADEDEEDDY